MDHRYERILKMHRILATARRPVLLERMMDALDCSRATVYRDIAFLRDALHAPIESSEDPAGFMYVQDEHQPRFELPGLWLSSQEMQALLTTSQLFARQGTEWLDEAVAPLRERIESMLEDQTSDGSWPMDRIRVIAAAHRYLDEQTFRLASTAVLERKQLTFEYRARSTNHVSQRHVSPQRLTHYRDNWYLDAFDHDRDALRSFAVDQMRHASVKKEEAISMSSHELDEVLASGFGIFSGKAQFVATLRFSEKAARWVADETWHSRQEGHFLPDGRYELKVPYSYSRELIMEVLRHGPDVEVVAPVMLREEARSMLLMALAQYEE